MPYGDRTGPLGLGPRTGRGAGYCSGYAAPGAYHPAFGGARFGFGSGRGAGRRWLGRGGGWRCWYNATGMPGWARFGYGYPGAPAFSAREEIAVLQQEADFLKRQLENIQNRISTLEAGEKQEN